MPKTANYADTTYPEGGPNINPYPSEMRSNLWPLCCGLKIISGFKDTTKVTVDNLKKVLAATPHNQVFTGETINPNAAFVVLNPGQQSSPHITGVLKDAGFKHVMDIKSRSGQHLWLRSGSAVTMFADDGKHQVAF